MIGKRRGGPTCPPAKSQETFWKNQRDGKPVPYRIHDASAKPQRPSHSIKGAERLPSLFILHHSLFIIHFIKNSASLRFGGGAVLQEKENEPEY
jgi:hypothetical protein